jgi:hypothetical protein
MLEYFKVIYYNDKIRLGNNGDGGYVIADIPNYDCYISAGIGTDESFSKDLINHFNITNAHAFDGTITKLPTNCPSILNIYPVNIGPIISQQTANLRRFIDNYQNIFLKMDIEGAEYDWIYSLSNNDLLKFKQITIELHFINDNSLGINHSKKINCFRKLFQTHYIIHIHANNVCGTTNNIPNVVEVTYVRKNCINYDIKYNTLKLPDNKLDFPNSAQMPEIDLNFYPFVVR